MGMRFESLGIGRARIEKIHGLADTFRKKSPSTITNNADVTYTANQVMGGVILRDPNGAARNDTTPTAAALIAEMFGKDREKAYEGAFFLAFLRNTADANEVITVVGGAGVTISGTATIGQNNTKIFCVCATNCTPGSEAVTAYSIGTLVH